MEEDVKKKLRDLFDDMLTKVGEFKRKTYSDVFEEGYGIYKSLPEEIAGLCEEAEEDRREELVEELALVIPDYALGKIGERSKKEKDQLYVDFNLNMAVYVVPVLNYSGNEWCEKLAKRMVELWLSLIHISIRLFNSLPERSFISSSMLRSCSSIAIRCAFADFTSS